MYVRRTFTEQINHGIAVMATNTVLSDHASACEHTYRFLGDTECRLAYE